MLYLDSRFLKIEWDEDLRCVCTQYKDAYADGDEYRSALTEILDLITSKRASRLLGDGRLMRVVSSEDQAWVESSWLPRSIQGGLRHSALILPKSTLAKISVQRILTKYRLSDSSSVDVTNAYFDSVEAAKQWLRTMPG